MERKARLDSAAGHGLATQERYEELLDELATIRLKKVIAYGERRYESVDDEFNLWMSWCDVYRKTIRIETMMKNMMGKHVGQQLIGEDGELLLDTYMDLANYAILAIQVLEGRKVDA